MVIIRVMGGLGNQMYQYALYIRFLQEGRDATLDLSSYADDNKHRDKRKFGLDIFPNIEYVACTSKERANFVDNSRLPWKRIRRKLLGNRTNIYRETIPYEPEIFYLQNVYLQGYWNCEKYYENLIPQLRRVFHFPEDTDARNIEILNQIERAQSISVHIRRGDYLSQRHKERFGSICNEKYYDTAINYLRKAIKNPHFFIFSDDSDYIRERYQGEEYTIIDWNGSEENSIYDMKLISKCKYNICANSTFSKWGAILNENPERIRLCPLKHTIEENMSIDTRKKLWTNWVFIDQEGNIYE